MEIRKVKSIKDLTQIELLNSKLAKANAIIDYLAMMTDIELPNKEGEVMENE